MKASIFLFSTILIFCANVFAQIEKPLKELEADLKKIEESIEVTRNKMKEVKDVAFVPDLYFVLAELHVDKARYLYTINRLENPDTPIDELDFSESQKAKRQAIEIYTRYIENFPKADNLDKAYFFMAHEYRELGLNEDMVKTYQKIIQSFPKSQYWEESQIILGDFFLEQKKDPELALDFYKKVIDRPRNPFMPTARYKMGWSYINLNKFTDALLAFEGVLTTDKDISLEDLPDIYKKSDVRRDALLAMVWPYSEQKTLAPHRSNALSYFERLSPHRTALLKVLSRLSKRLMLKEKIDEAIPVYMRMLDLANDLEEQISAVDGLYEAIKKSKKKYDLTALPDRLTNILLRVRGSKIITNADKAKIEKNWEIYIRDFATQIQKAAKESGSKVYYDKAIAAYDHYISVFPRSRYRAAMHLNQAEIYFAKGDYARAGYKYEYVLRILRQRAKKDVVQSVIESYAKALKQQDKLPKIELYESREGFRNIGRYFIRRFPKDPANAMIQFNMARTYYDERDFDRAVIGFKNFINLYPSHKEAPTAGQLIMDSFNQREDYEGLIKAGRELIANPRFKNQSFKADVAEIIKQAEFRKIQDTVGDPRSREYAKKLLSFASKYQGTALGDQALYEAFTNLKSKKDLSAYAPGEQLLAKHADSKYAKDVVGQMGKMAVNTADYRRATRYFEIFFNKYPNDPEARKLMEAAANMREYMADFQEAANNYQILGRSEDRVRQYIMARDWRSAVNALNQSRSNSFNSMYWLGLSNFRLGESNAAVSAFNQLLRMPARSFDEKTKAAHALYLLASIDLKTYQNLQLGGGDEAAVVKAKSDQLNRLTAVFDKVISYGNGKWTIASLYELGRANKEFAQFLQNASVPPGLDAQQQQQYKTLIAQQAKQYITKANTYFRSCNQNAEKFEVFTRFATGCQSAGDIQINESSEEFTYSRASDSDPVGIESIRKALIDSPRNTQLLMRAVQSYIKAGDYSMARLVISRILEINDRDTEAMGWMGIAFMYIKDYDSAAEWFKKATKIKSNESTAIYGLAALYKQFRFSSKLRQIQGRVKSTPRPKGPVHPWMASL